MMINKSTRVFSDASWNLNHSLETLIFHKIKYLLRFACGFLDQVNVKTTDDVNFFVFSGNRVHNIWEAIEKRDSRARGTIETR